jgi:hypothetical protein
MRSSAWAGVGEDAEELQLGGVELSPPRKGERHHPDRSPHHVQRQTHHQPGAVARALQVRISRLDRLPSEEHQPFPGPDHVSGQGRLVAGIAGPTPRSPIETATQPDQGKRVVVDHHRERRDRRTDCIGCLGCHHPGHRFDVLGRAELGCHPGETRQPIVQPARLAVLAALVELVVDQAHHSHDCVVMAKWGARDVGRAHGAVDPAYVEQTRPVKSTEHLTCDLVKDVDLVLGQQAGGECHT